MQTYSLPQTYSLLISGFAFIGWIIVPCFMFPFCISEECGASPEYFPILAQNVCSQEIHAAVGGCNIERGWEKEAWRIRSLGLSGCVVMEERETTACFCKRTGERLEDWIWGQKERCGSTHSLIIAPSGGICFLEFLFWLLAGLKQ